MSVATTFVAPGMARVGRLSAETGMRPPAPEYMDRSYSCKLHGRMVTVYARVAQGIDQRPVMARLDSTISASDMVSEATARGRITQALMGWEPTNEGVRLALGYGQSDYEPHPAILAVDSVEIGPLESSSGAAG